MELHSSRDLDMSQLVAVAQPDPIAGIDHRITVVLILQYIHSRLVGLAADKR
jgi:hypothetical protein